MWMYRSVLKVTLLISFFCHIIQRIVTESVSPFGAIYNTAQISSNSGIVGLSLQNSDEKLRTTGSSSAINVINNHDFSAGLDSWHPNCCEAFVVSPDSSCVEGKSNKIGDRYAVITSRKESWQGLEQDITTRVSTGSTYVVSAHVGISGTLQGFADVQATLKLEYHNLHTNYVFIGRKSVSQDSWEKLEGTFSLTTMPDRVVFYLEGPSPGVNLLIKSVVISCSNSTMCDNKSKGSKLSEEGNIISNSTFDDGLNNWSGRGCKILLHDSMSDGKIVPQSGKFFAAATQRTQNWNGIQQEITGKVKRKLAYEVDAVVRLYGNNASNSEIRATLWVQSADQREQYIGIAK